MSDFEQWLDTNRSANVSEVFHDIVAGVTELEATLKAAKAGIEWALSNINCEPFEWSDEENADAHREAIEALAKINEVLKP